MRSQIRRVRLVALIVVVLSAVAAPIAQQGSGSAAADGNTRSDACGLAQSRAADAARQSCGRYTVADCACRQIGDEDWTCTARWTCTDEVRDLLLAEREPVLELASSTASQRTAWQPPAGTVLQPPIGTSLEVCQDQRIPAGYVVVSRNQPGVSRCGRRGRMVIQKLGPFDDGSWLYEVDACEGRPQIRLPPNGYVVVASGVRAFPPGSCGGRDGGRRRAGGGWESIPWPASTLRRLP